MKERGKGRKGEMKRLGHGVVKGIEYETKERRGRKREGMDTKIIVTSRFWGTKGKGLKEERRKGDK